MPARYVRRKSRNRFAAVMPWLLRAIKTPAALSGYVSAYLYIILASLPAAFLYNLYGALLRSVGRANAALAVLAGAVTVNLALDVWFVAGLGLGIGWALVNVFWTVIKLNMKKTSR